MISRVRGRLNGIWHDINGEEATDGNTTMISMVRRRLMGI